MKLAHGNGTGHGKKKRLSEFNSMNKNESREFSFTEFEQLTEKRNLLSPKLFSVTCSISVS